VWHIQRIYKVEPAMLSIFPQGSITDRGNAGFDSARLNARVPPVVTCSIEQIEGVFVDTAESNNVTLGQTDSNICCFGGCYIATL
jgi:hypothetical protein